MFHFNSAFEDQVQLSLNLVHYEKINPDTLPQPFQVNVADSISISEKNENSLQTFIERKVSLEPAGLFSIMIRYEVVWKPKNWSLISDVDNTQIIQAMIAEKKDFLGSIAARTCLLIAQLTTSLGLAPLITPPELITK